MIIKLSEKYRKNIHTNLTNYFKGADVLVEFFKGAEPTTEEGLDMISTDRLADKLGEVKLPIGNDFLNVSEASFTPSVNGTCAWVRISKIDSPKNFMCTSFITDLNAQKNSLMELEDLNFDTTKTNTIKKCILHLA